ncbi:MAG TPA: nitrous oxide reductase accessory protein NosL [Chitinophagaceae bacterium]|nr:nitrous oxide reductase accessory protein NosL [Chitinophagaceae bacterium]
MNKNIARTTRIVAAISALALILVIFLPIWKIELSAPQYPEGLIMKIYANRLGGDVEVVNGLNHYIGMRTLHERDFVEFAVLPYIFGIFALFGLLAVFIRRKWFYFTWVALFLIFSAMAMIDFYRWEYNYGHNLDPTAPIQVPGMTYQPPLIGYKQLLNFGAFSIPDAGGWLFIGVALAMLITCYFELRKTKVLVIDKTAAIPALMFAVLLFASCKSGPQPIKPAIDACSFCKMTVMDTRFGGEILTRKGKVFIFDDLHCLLAYNQSGQIEKKDIAQIYLLNYAHPGELLRAENCLIIKSEGLHSPMGGNMAAFSKQADAERVKQTTHGEYIQWSDLYKY